MSLRARLERLERSSDIARRCLSCGERKSGGVRCIVFSGLNLLPAGITAARALDSEGKMFLRDGSPVPPSCPACGRWPGIPTYYSRSFLEAVRARADWATQ